MFRRFGQPPSDSVYPDVQGRCRRDIQTGGHPEATCRWCLSSINRPAEPRAPSDQPRHSTIRVCRTGTSVIINVGSRLRVPAAGTAGPRTKPGSLKQRRRRHAVEISAEPFVSTSAQRERPDTDARAGEGRDCACVQVLFENSRLAKMMLTRSGGRSSTSSRTRITEGSVARAWARSAPKSVSAEMMFDRPRQRVA